MFKKRTKKGNIRTIQPDDNSVKNNNKDLSFIQEKVNVDIEESTKHEKNPKIELEEHVKEERKRKLFDASARETDYNPMICRPYYETGYCGFGDNCIYRHDREEIEHSYELKMESKPVLDLNKYCPGCSKNLDTLHVMQLSCSDEMCRDCARKNVKSKQCQVCNKAIEPSLKPAKRKVSSTSYKYKKQR